MTPKSRTKTHVPDYKVVAGQATPAFNYGEVQAEEVLALQSIYMDDFEDVKSKSAWSKTDRSFNLRLRAFSAPDASVVLSVRLTATYPKSAPLLDVSSLDGFHERTQKRVRNILASRPKALLGEVMIHEIASEIQDALEDAVSARQQGTLPSLEEERVTADDLATEHAKEAEEAERRLHRESQEEEDRVLRQMADDLVQRRDKRKPAKEVRDIDATVMEDILDFEQVAEVIVSSEVAQFSKVALCGSTTVGAEELARPVVSHKNVPLVAVVKTTITGSREMTMQTESTLELVRKLRHPGILGLLAFRVDKLHGDTSRVTLCTEHADRGTLHDLLGTAILKPDKARHYIVDVLEALDYMHHRGLAHGNLNCRSVYMHGISLAPKLGNLGHWMLDTEHDALPTKWKPDSKTPDMHNLQKADIWHLGVMTLQMFLGIDIISRYLSPASLLNRLDLSDAFVDFLHKTFSESDKRPSAFDLLPSEFLRTDSPIYAAESALPTSQRYADIASPAKHRSRHNSSHTYDAPNREPSSRYTNDFTELGRLGKGGFGEVVKARNKLDGGVYAIKKIRQAPDLLDKVLSEVILLNRLNHPYVVRYYSTWLESDISDQAHEDDSSAIVTDERTRTDSGQSEHVGFGYQSTGGLDFISSGYPNVEFGGDDSSEHSNDPEDPAESDPEQYALALRKRRSDIQRPPSVLYIQMEYCERRTLRDLVLKGMSTDDSWKYMRRITEGLAHIHGHGIIHRDLKPDNVFIDVAGNPKIGDFGLATTGQHNILERAVHPNGQSGYMYDGGGMTRSVGTTLYVAPELRSRSQDTYSEKVDMYSLGIMFYEMCEVFGTAMERIRSLQHIRDRPGDLPPVLCANGAKSAQGKLIARLISHKPAERPTSTELLRSDVLPVRIEDETLRQAISGLSDWRSPYHQQILSALFASDVQRPSKVQAMAWDAKASSMAPSDDAHRLRCRSEAISTLEMVFRRHGAEPSHRESIFPKSTYYANANVISLLDAAGNLLQLPYDLTLPHARYLARQLPIIKKTYSIGTVYRDAFTGGPPRANDEVDYDIALAGEDRSIDDAEVLKVADEFMSELLPDASSRIHINHYDILDSALELCRVPTAQHSTAKEILSKLGFHQWTWSKVRAELRKFGLSDTSLDDLQQLDFRENPEKAFIRLRAISTKGSKQVQARIESAIASLEATMSYASQLSLKHRIYVVPLSSVNAKFYAGGMLFQCVLERKTNAVLAAGGRYDSLVQAHRDRSTVRACEGAVGVSIGLDAIVTHMVKYGKGHSDRRAYLRKEDQAYSSFQRRCDVTVQASTSDGPRNVALQILARLWESNISAELSAEQKIPSSHLDSRLLVTVRHEASNTVRVTKTFHPDSDEADVPISSLVSHLQQELRNESGKFRPPALGRQVSQQDSERKANVQVLMAQHRSKKSNKYHIVEAAQQRWSEKLAEWKDAPILAIETSDAVLDVIRDTKLADAESWRRAVQGVQLNERQYLGQVQGILATWRKVWADDDGAREACVFNFRTGSCIYYDLGL
ncbi:hypothetical protein BAUCODRAFT_32896 [Baudoinia panamericana UAMH 10762]|uniref:non-specific serine/threonine protein kinase n=1 Tax=Baudoinia panamericana (strain UAMH 10762) TaxID=717646 RepID=M2NE03_BAUPA|nr:uncharacterized protein BAUCODRAFT_32896 [Baudoinia panamericana UAMH 10762]EMC97155.1 hypothetical protein BAUCODRAFT_32896 [Baudoinia panamericana UAMH 10762]